MIRITVVAVLAAAAIPPGAAASTGAVLRVALYADHMAVRPGGVVRYQATVSNASDTASAETLVLAHVPEHTAIVTERCRSGSPATYTGGACASASVLTAGHGEPVHQIAVDAGPLAPGASSSVRFAVAVDADAPLGSRLVNHAHAGASTSEELEITIAKDETPAALPAVDDGCEARAMAAVDGVGIARCTGRFPETLRPRGHTTRVSVSSHGTEAQSPSHDPAITPDGRYVAFTSFAANLAPDTNHLDDVFLHDTLTSETTRVAVSSGGLEAAGGRYGSHDPSLSADGRFVAFASDTTNLVPGDTNGNEDVFVHDLATGETTRVSIASDGAQAQGPFGSGYPSISADGRVVAFCSHATNFGATDANGRYDVFVHDASTGETSLVSARPDGAAGNDESCYPAISSDGRSVAFVSYADDLLSDDGNFVADVFVRDLVGGTTRRASLVSGGGEVFGQAFGPSISGDGSRVTFISYSSKFVADDVNESADVFVHDMRSLQTVRVSVSASGIEADGNSPEAQISADGEHVVFASTASNLVPDDANATWDVFVHDIPTAETHRVSVGPLGAEADGLSVGEAIAADGSTVAFGSVAGNLVSGDANKVSDVFVHDRAATM
jgi:Tol biopolymer transport system component